MNSLLAGITGNSRVQQILICWTTPLLIGAFAFVIVVLPDVRHAAAVASVEAAVRVLNINKFLLVFIASLVTSVFLYVNRLPLWRFLEGYTWPGFLRRWRIVRAHVPQCRWLQAALEYERAEFTAGQAEAEFEKAATDHATDEQIRLLRKAIDEAQKAKNDWLAHRDAANLWRLTRDRKRKNPKDHGWLPRRQQPLFTFGRPASAQPGRWTLPYPAVPGKLSAYPGAPEYPADIASTQILPTRLGNAMRVMETYGVNTYGLDSQIMWYELLTESPESMQATLEQAQLEADTLVCGIYTMVALACSALAGAIWRAVGGTADAKLWTASVISVVVALILYRRLLNSVESWASLVRTLVNKARDVLREKYGLRTPSSPEDEKRMWQALTASHWYGPDAVRTDELARYKRPGQTRRLASEREQFAEASRVEVVLAVPRGGPTDLEPRPPLKLELTVKNHGSYAILDIEAMAWVEMLTGAGLFFFSEPRQEQRSDALNPASPYWEPVHGSHPDWLPPWDARLIFEEDLPSPLKSGKEGAPAYPIVRWTDRWGTGWEHMRGKLQQVDRSEGVKYVLGPGGPAGP